MKLKFPLLILFSSLAVISCRQVWGDNDLGDNFTLLEGDKTEDQIIVYCSGRSGGACYAGTAIVPVYSRQFDKQGDYAEYVEVAKANKKFIIAQTLQIKEKKKNYWIISKAFKIDNCDKINCDSMINTYVVGPLDSSQFQVKLIELNTGLNFHEN